MTAWGLIPAGWCISRSCRRRSIRVSLLCAAFSLLKQAGRVSQEKERRELVIDRVYRIDDGERFLVAVPYDEGLRLRFTSLSEHALVGTQYRDYLLREDTYEKGEDEA